VNPVDSPFLPPSRFVVATAPQGLSIGLNLFAGGECVKKGKIFGSSPIELCKSMQLIKTTFGSNIFNGRPLASLVRLPQTISGRPGRILFPLPFGQI